MKVLESEFPSFPSAVQEWQRVPCTLAFLSLLHCLVRPAHFFQASLGLLPLLLKAVPGLCSPLIVLGTHLASVVPLPRHLIQTFASKPLLPPYPGNIDPHCVPYYRMNLPGLFLFCFSFPVIESYRSWLANSYSVFLKLQDCSKRQNACFVLKVGGFSYS